MGRENREPGVLERDETHEHVAMRSLAADLIGIHAGGLVSVVAVGDQQLGAAQRLGRRFDRRRVGDAPQPVDGAVVIGRVAPGRLVRGRLCQCPLRGAIRVGEQREDGGEVRLGRARETETVLTGTGMGALMRTNASGAVRFHPHAREEATAGPCRPVRTGVVLLDRPQRRRVVGDEHALAFPLADEFRGVGVRVGLRRRSAAAGRCGRR